MNSSKFYANFTVQEEENGDFRVSDLQGSFSVPYDQAVQAKAILDRYVAMGKSNIERLRRAEWNEDDREREASYKAKSPRKKNTGAFNRADLPEPKFEAGDKVNLDDFGDVYLITRPPRWSQKDNNGAGTWTYPLKQVSPGVSYLNATESMMELVEKGN